MICTITTTIQIEKPSTEQQGNAICGIRKESTPQDLLRKGVSTGALKRRENLHEIESLWEQVNANCPEHENDVRFDYTWRVTGQSDFQ
jgi:hypothetical protein